MSRLPSLTPSAMSTEQRELYEALLGGPRSGAHGKSNLTTEEGALVGPFNAWLFSPRTGAGVSQLGEKVRFESSLPKRAIEIAILVTAKHWQAQFEWWAHERIARQLELGEDILSALKAGEAPALEDPQEQLVYDFATELLQKNQVSDDVYAKVRYHFGEHGIVDLVTLLGYYGLVSMTLNVFQIPLPADEELPFPPTD